MKMLKILPAVLLGFMTAGFPVMAADFVLHEKGDNVDVAFNDKDEVYVMPPHVSFRKGTGETVWISDIELLTMPNDKSKHLVANAPHKTILGVGKIPAGNRFELFPYHYADEGYEKVLGGTISYRLLLKNETTGTVTVTLEGMGTALNWEHWRTWSGALGGQNSMVKELKPNEELTLWNPVKMKQGLPYSAVALGRVSGGDLSVYDYCYTGDKDPGMSGCRPLPDLTWPPYDHPSFIRGLASWFTGKIGYSALSRLEDGSIPVSDYLGKSHSVAFGFSAGGPITNLCDYKAVSPTFVDDVCLVSDPVSSASHIFFGGNYPMIYSLDLPLKNNTDKPVEIEFLLASNDKFGVHTYTGVSMAGKFLEKDAPTVVKGKRWKVWTLTLKPGERYDANMRIIPLGSRWGGLIASIKADYCR